MKMYNEKQISPEGTYLYALNVVNKNEEGVSGEIISELGNTIAITIPLNYSLIGHVECPNGKVYLFLQHKFVNIFRIVEGSTTILSTNCFNYSSKRPIKGEYRVTDCDELLYFYDGEEPDRFINLTHLNYHQVSGAYVCETFLLKPEFSMPKVKISEIINVGGNLKSGSYELFVRYVDKTGNRTDWSIPSNEVYVYDTPYPNLIGVDTKSFNPIVGSNKYTQKVLNFEISNLDTKYKYVEYAICINKSEGYIYDKTTIASTVNVYIRDVAGKIPISYSELITPTAKYKSSKVMLQQDNRLIRANLKEEKFDWKEIQRLYANNIQIQYYVDFNVSQKEINSNLSLMRDEVYAIGIVYVMADGSLSPVLHIPGREIDKYPDGTPIPYTTTDPNTHNRPLPTTGWDSSVYSSNADSEHISYDFERWQVYNTAISLGSSTGICGYHEVRDYSNNPVTYPEVYDCKGELIYPNDNGTMLPIRHHRMPDTTLEPHYSNTGILPLNLTAINVNLPDGAVGYYLCISDRNYERTIFDKGIVTSIVQREFNKYVAEDDISNSDYKAATILHQSLQTSKSNNQPKSYTLQTSDQFNFLSGKDQRFLCIPACSETLAYKKEMSEEVANRASIHPSLVGFHSPKSKLDKEVFKSSLIKFELELSTDGSNDRFVHNIRSKYKNKESDKLIHTEVSIFPTRKNKPYDELTSRIVKDTSFVATDSTYNSINLDYTFVNKTQQELGLIKIYSTIDSLPTKWVLDSGSNFPDSGIDAGIMWAKPNLYTDATQTYIDNALGTPEQSHQMTYNYVSLKQYNPLIYNTLENIKYHICSDYNSNVIYGDSFICKFAFRQTFYGYVPHAGNWNSDTQNQKFIFGKNTDTPTNGNTGNYDNLNGSYNSVWEANLIETYYETDVNIEYREEGEETFYQTEQISEDNPNDFASFTPVYYQKFYPKSYNNPEDFLMLELNSNAISRLKDNGEWTKYTLFPNYYKLQDFYNNLRRYQVLPMEYKECSDCDGVYPNRIIWSNKSHYDEDTYRQFLVNNSKDIYTNSKEITDLFELKNNIFVHQTEGLLLLPTSSETLELNATNVNIGLGEYLSLPAKKIGNMTYNYAGNQGRFNRFSSEYGTFFVNQIQGVIYNFQEGLNEISNDYAQWFLENLPCKMEKYWKDTFKLEYPLRDNTCDDYGVGLQSTIDYRTDRWILHKKDFTPLLPISFTLQSGKIYWDGEVFRNDQNQQIFFENTNYFKNESFTISYDMVEKHWISFHSYQPNWMFQNGNTFFTQVRLDATSNPNYNIYRHDSNNVATFYGEKYPVVIEWQVSNTKSVVNSISYYARFQEYDNTLKTWKDVDGEFEKGFLYNTYQTTFMFDITNNNTFLWNDTVKNSMVRENIHTINGFRQLNLDSDVITKEWNVLKSSYANGQGYENYVAVPPVGYVSRFHLQNPIRDVFTNARLYYYDNARLRFQTVTKDTTNSLR